MTELQLLFDDLYDGETMRRHDESDSPYAGLHTDTTQRLTCLESASAAHKRLTDVYPEFDLSAFGSWLIESCADPLRMQRTLVLIPPNTHAWGTPASISTRSSSTRRRRRKLSKRRSRRSFRIRSTTLRERCFISYWQRASLLTNVPQIWPIIKTYRIEIPGKGDTHGGAVLELRLPSSTTFLAWTTRIGGGRRLLGPLWNRHGESHSSLRSPRSAS